MASISYHEILIALFCFIFLSCLRKKSILPRDWPLVGMLPDLFLNRNRVHEWAAEVLEQSSCNFVFKGPWFANMDMLVTADPANVRYIMTANFSNFPKGIEFMKRFDIMGNAFLNSDSDLWRIQRRLAQAFLQRRPFHHFVLKISAEKLEKGLIPVLEHASERGLVVDLQDVFQNFSYDVTTTLVTGYDPCSLSIELPTVPFSEAMNNMAEAISTRYIMPEKFWKLQRWLGVGMEKKLSQAWQTIDEFIARHISMKREELSKGEKCNNGEEGVDLLTSYMSEYEISEVFKSEDKFLRDTTLNFMIAGRDTISSALTWFFWLVSENASVQERIRDEIQANIPTKEGEKLIRFEMKELDKLAYLHGALCESLRLYPPIPFEHKAPLRPDMLPSGHRVNPKMKILVPIYAMGRMTSIWGNDSFGFKPERWISEKGGIKHEPSYKFMVFNSGPRACLGKEMSFTQLKLVAATMIHNYNIHVEEGHPVTPNVSIVLQMKYGLKVKVTKRWA